ncbi:hypothetical protein [Leucobacter chromiiresistens]|uniref:Uncharacterized protein n=1 Tax=Leucobacter chromiiresistens TaxID=1079994 RepID=A0A1H1BLV9_9MICO|nr:hypothetical protein [Leucobacter chromiiresistens]SDQ52938.1 hypothetical protein SAMN04488565_2910 [Leucobacter chromiiresistens]
MTLRRSLDEVTENTLEQWAVALTAGEIKLWELPPSVSQLYLFGHIDGAKSRQAEIDQLTRSYEHKLDTAYMLTFTPKEQREEYQRRLDKYFHERDAAFFAEPAQLTDLHSLRGGQEPPEAGVEDASNPTPERGDRAA